MKILWSYVFTLIFVAACSSSGEYTIDSNILGLSKGDKLTLYYLDENKSPKMLNFATAEQEHVVLKGTVNEPRIGYIKVSDLGNIDLIIEPGNLKIKSYKDSIFKSTVTGTKNNLDMMSYKRQISTYNRKIELARITLKNTNSSNLEKAQRDYNKIRSNAQQKIQEYRLNFVDLNRNSFVSLLLLDVMKHNPKSNMKQLRKLFNNLSLDLLKTEYANHHLKDLKSTD